MEIMAVYATKEVKTACPHECMQRPSFVTLIIAAIVYTKLSQLRHQSIQNSAYIRSIATPNRPIKSAPLVHAVHCPSLTPLRKLHCIVARLLVRCMTAYLRLNNRSTLHGVQ